MGSFARSAMKVLSSPCLILVRTVKATLFAEYYAPCPAQLIYSQALPCE